MCTEKLSTVEPRNSDSNLGTILRPRVERMDCWPVLTFSGCLGYLAMRCWKRWGGCSLRRREHARCVEMLWVRRGLIGQCQVCQPLPSSSITSSTSHPEDIYALLRSTGFLEAYENFLGSGDDVATWVIGHPGGWEGVLGLC